MAPGQVELEPRLPGMRGRQALPDEGIIAFQLHSGFKSMEVTFKDIKFKELTSK